MGARYNDPEIHRLILRMSGAGLGCHIIGRELGIAKTTVRWHIRNNNESEPPQEPPNDERPICFVCHAPCQSWDGHDRCRGRKAA